MRKAGDRSTRKLFAETGGGNVWRRLVNLQPQMGGAGVRGLGRPMASTRWTMRQRPLVDGYTDNARIGMQRTADSDFASSQSFMRYVLLHCKLATLLLNSLEVGIMITSGIDQYQDANARCFSRSSSAGDWISRTRDIAQAPFNPKKSPIYARLPTNKTCNRSPSQPQAMNRRTKECALLLHR